VKDSCRRTAVSITADGSHAMLISGRKTSTLPLAPAPCRSLPVSAQRETALDYWPLPVLLALPAV
jgi:hypothetical protein